jgi:heme/copper-type cytochrome/quinol oxidase subunit 2
MVAIVVGITILVIVVGAVIYAMVALRDDKGPKKRITPFGEITEENTDTQDPVTRL